MGSATLVYQIDRSGAVVTISPIDVATSGGLATLGANLVSGVPAKVFGIPQPDGTLKAYVLITTRACCRACEESDGAGCLASTERRRGSFSPAPFAHRSPALMRAGGYHARYEQ